MEGLTGAFGELFPAIKPPRSASVRMLCSCACTGNPTIFAPSRLRMEEVGEENCIFPKTPSNWLGSENHWEQNGAFSSSEIATVSRDSVIWWSYCLARYSC